MTSLTSILYYAAIVVIIVVLSIIGWKVGKVMGMIVGMIVGIGLGYYVWMKYVRDRTTEETHDCGCHGAGCSPNYPGSSHSHGDRTHASKWDEWTRGENDDDHSSGYRHSSGGFENERMIS